MRKTKLFSYVFVLSAFGFLFWHIFKNWATVQSFSWNFEYMDIAMLMVSVSLVFPINSIAWHLVTRALGANISLEKNLQVWMFSNIARFLPGGFWQYPGRVYLSGKSGLSRTLATTAVVLEAIFVLSIGALVVLATFFFWKLPLDITGIEPVLFFVVSLPLLLSFLSNQKVATSIAKMLARISGKDETTIKVSLPFHWIPILATIFFLQFFFAGSILFILSKAVVELSFTAYPIFIGIFAASWLIGYITFFAPSGLGVQEASIAALLSFYMPFPVAGIIAILLRILLFVAEGMFLLFVSLRFRKDLIRIV